MLPALFEDIWITPTVAAEYGLPLPTWAIIQPVGQLPSPEQIPERFGLGERSAIGLALGLADCLLIIDDEQPKQLAKEMGLIARLRPVVEQLRTVAGMWLSDHVAERVCRAAGE